MVFGLVRAELRAILVAGLIAGTLDIGAACLINSVAPVLVMKSIAAGLLGMTAFDGAAGTAALGLGLQYFMSWIIAAAYFIVAANLPAVRSNWLPSGLAYGVIVFVVMNYGVLPLSAFGHAPMFHLKGFAENLLAMLVFGLIMAIGARGARH
jgi:hypothetical protein